LSDAGVGSFYYGFKTMFLCVNICVISAARGLPPVISGTSELAINVVVVSRSIALPAAE
jgi:hypothetical protein